METTRMGYMGGIRSFVSQGFRSGDACSAYQVQRVCWLVVLPGSLTAFSESLCASPVFAGRTLL